MIWPQTVTIAILCIFLWHRQRSKNYHKVVDDLDELDKQERQTRLQVYRLTSGLMHGFVIAILATIFAVVVGICSTHKLLSFEPSTASLTTFKSTPKSFSCNVHNNRYTLHNVTDETSSAVWEICFRWLMGFVAPIFVFALPSLSHLNFRLMEHDHEVEEEDISASKNNSRADSWDQCC